MKFGLKEIVLGAGILIGASKADGQLWNIYNNEIISAYENLNGDFKKEKVSVIDSSSVKSKNYNYIISVNSEETFRISKNLVKESFKLEDVDSDGDYDITFLNDVSKPFTKKGEPNKGVDYVSNLKFVKEPEYETVVLKNDGKGNFSE